MARETVCTSVTNFFLLRSFFFLGFAVEGLTGVTPAAGGGVDDEAAAAEEDKDDDGKVAAEAGAVGDEEDSENKAGVFTGRDAKPAGDE